MPRLPQVSGRALIRLLHSLDTSRHGRREATFALKKATPVGEHNLTVPDHKSLAKGTLNDILTSVSLWNGISKDELIKRL
jgi:predicted RNA binding protein YcfA (HicA-like mRNA interferase family)